MWRSIIQSVSSRLLFFVAQQSFALYLAGEGEDLFAL